MNFQDLMLERIHEILLVASPYDAFILEEDGRLTQQILYEYLGMNLSYAPRVWHAQTGAAALEMLSNRKIDLVIVLMRISDMDPISFGAKIQDLKQDIPIILLAFDESELAQIPENALQTAFDKIFIWSGNANVFPAIIKYIEDKKNIKRDFEIADIRSIMVVEDNPRHYSVFLPLLYKIALKHARSLINQSLSDTERLLAFRARPKIILTSTYEEALEFYNTYGFNVLGLISDVRFPKNGKLDPDAGVELTKFVREKDPALPIILQSTNKDHQAQAVKEKAHFIHKESTSLLQDFEKLILNNFGFGDFVFRNKQQREIQRAVDLVSLKKAVTEIPLNTLEYHASSNHFSNWLAVRGEFDISSALRPIKVADFNDLEDLRKVIIEAIDRVLEDQHQGKIVQYSKQVQDPKSGFFRISTGSLGGKARGLAFANQMLNESGIREKFPMVKIRVPRIAVLGIDEFDSFMTENNLWPKALEDKSNSAINRLFLKASLSKELKKLLSKFVNDVRYPLAIRSSSLLEDSQYQPLAGMYSTFMIPNVSKKKKARLNQLCDAVKLVYASMFHREPKSLIESSVHHLEEERMAVMIMELIGKKHSDRFYPTLSGSAQSYNYYPVSYMRREEGVAFLALGLGRTVVEGEKALRFSPKYPGILPQYYSVKSTVENSQNQFYALNLSEDENLLKKGEAGNLNGFPLDVAEKDGELHWAGSVVCSEDSVIRDSLRYDGVRVITFPAVLKWNMIPLPEIISELLDMGEKSLGCPVEIEFAVNLYEKPDHKPEFCILQIKPMVIGGLDRSGELDHFNREDIFCQSNVALGNGVIENIRNIILISPDSFDPSCSEDIAAEIETINSRLNGSPCILVGPGRWGSADPWLGVPVRWRQISNAKVIVELGMKEYPIDPSFGSHFFQNVTSMRIGYFTIDHRDESDTIDLSWLTSNPILDKTKYTQWIQLKEPLTVNIEGHTGKGTILKPIKPLREMMDEQESPGI